MPTLQQQQETYNNILRLYDSIQNMVDAIDNPEAKNSTIQLDVAQDFILQASESTSIIMEIYMAHLQRGDHPTDEDSRLIADATRKIFSEAAVLVDRAKKLVSNHHIPNHQ